MVMHDSAHPGEVIRDLCLEPLKLSVTEAAKRVPPSDQLITEIASHAREHEI